MVNPFEPPVLEAVAAEFPLEGAVREIRPYGNGHINHTFVIGCDGGARPIRYILQRVNERVFRDVPRLMENVARVTAHLAGRLAGHADRQALTLLPTRSGRPWFTDAQGGHWRLYRFVEGATSHDVLTSPRQAYEAARAFGDFQRLLSDLPAPRLHDTIPHFHDTRRRLAAFEAAVQADAAGRVVACGPEIEAVRRHAGLAEALLRLAERGDAPERVTHNDTKINNVMLDDVTGAGVCVIDLDTVMPGLSLYDFGDMVRTAGNTAVEDETDLSKVRVDLTIFSELARGFLETAGPVLTPAEVAHLGVAAQVMTYECGMRFLTDHLSGDVYFRIKRPGHNLDRFRCQLALVRSMVACAAEMDRRVQTLSSR